MSPRTPLLPGRTQPLALAALALLALLGCHALGASAPPARTAAVRPWTAAPASAPGRVAILLTTPAARYLVPVDDQQLVAVTGGTCTTCSSGGGGGGGGTGSSGTPLPVGSPYWVTYRVSLTSSSYTPATLASRINNWSNLTISGAFSYTRKVIRDVQFSGGFASFVRASVGGEVSLSSTATVSYPVPPMSYGKLYVKYYTARQTYYGHQYQDYTDGSRTIVDNDSGPYQSTSTVLGYVTGPL